jgi:hypothetical protein
MTDKEVVVVRFYMIKNVRGVEWQAVQRSTCGEGELTINLAIWTFVAMASNPQYRSYTGPGPMVNLSVWCRVASGYRHPISGRVLPILPGGATLSPGQG